MTYGWDVSAHAKSVCRCVVEIVTSAALTLDAVWKEYRDWNGSGKFAPAFNDLASAILLAMYEEANGYSDSYTIAWKLNPGANVPSPEAEAAFKEVGEKTVGGAFPMMKLEYGGAWRLGRNSEGYFPLRLRHRAGTNIGLLDTEESRHREGNAVGTSVGDKTADEKYDV